MSQKVSIMIPTYNQAQWVGKAVESALAQSYADLEVIVCDDNSTDGTEEVVRSFGGDPRLKYYRNPTNLGRVGNYRAALYERATGTWALNVDGDDYLVDPNFVRDGLAAAEGKSDVVMVLAGYEFVSPIYGRLTDAPTGSAVEYVAGPRFFLRWISTSIVHHIAALYRREVAIRIGFYERDILSSDCESLRRLALHGNLALMNRTVGHWRTHGANSSYRLSVADHIQSLQCVFSPYAYAQELGHDGDELRNWRDRALADQVAVRMALFLANGHTREARQLLDSIHAYPEATRMVTKNPRLKLQRAVSAIGGKHLMSAVVAVNSRLKRQLRRFVDQPS
jgi:glycosyltransferase involved in cell wall biosynthesis